MILDLEKAASAERITGEEVVVFRDVAGEENHIRCGLVLDVRQSGDTFYVHAELTGIFSTYCHRCLDPTPCRVTPSFDLVVRKGDPHSKPEPATNEEGLIQLPVGENCVTLDEHIYENVMVNIPMQILCGEECKGLCAGCGVNLNRESCRCQATPDARWDGLRRQNGLPE